MSTVRPFGAGFLAAGQPFALKDYRTLPRADEVYVNEFGVAADGSDQSANLGRAMEAAAASGKGLVLPPGMVDASIVDVPEGTHLRGMPGSVLRRVAGHSDSGILRIAGDDVTIEGVTFDGNRGSGGETGGALVYATENISRFRVDRCRVRNAEAGGFWIVDPVRQIVVTDCEFRDMRSFGANVECFSGAADPHDVTVTRNRFDSTVNYPYGFIVRSHTTSAPEMYDVEVSGNKVYMPGNFVSGTGGITFGGFGIEVWASQALVTRNHVIYSSATTADEVGLSIVAGDSVISHNVVVNAGLGIEAAGSVRHGTEVSNNKLRGCRNGISSFGEPEGVSVHGNDIEGFTGVGIYASQNAAITGNTLTGTGTSTGGSTNTFGIEVSNFDRPTEDPLIYGNLIEIVAGTTLRIAVRLENVESFAVVGNKVLDADYGVYLSGDAGQVHRGVMSANDWGGCDFNAYVKVGASTVGDLVRWGNAGGNPADVPTITGSRGGNAALASLLTAMADRKVIVNSTTA